MLDACFWRCADPQDSFAGNPLEVLRIEYPAASSPIRAPVHTANILHMIGWIGQTTMAFVLDDPTFDVDRISMAQTVPSGVGLKDEAASVGIIDIQRNVANFPHATADS